MGTVRKKYNVCVCVHMSVGVLSVCVYVCVWMCVLVCVCVCVCTIVFACVIGIGLINRKKGDDRRKW